MRREERISRDFLAILGSGDVDMNDPRMRELVSGIRNMDPDLTPYAKAEIDKLLGNGQI